MEKIKIALVDNNHLEREETRILLENYFNRMPYRVKLREFASAMELRKDVTERGQHDIYIMEISMPDINGIRLAQELQSLGSMGAIIFLTRSIGDAIKAFEVRASDYVLKPLDERKRKRLIESLEIEICKAIKSPSVEIKLKEGYMRVPIDDITHVDVVDRALCFHLKNGRRLLTRCLRGTFKEDLERAVGMAMNLTGFIFAGKSSLLNLAYIMAMNHDRILLKNGDEVIVPKNSCRDVYQAWQEYQL